MKKRMLSIILMLILTMAVITCVVISASAEDTATATLPAATEGEVIDVWLIAGQSNAIGSAKVSNYPTDEAYAEYKTLLTNGSQNVWHLRNTYTDFVPTGFSQGSGTYSGPEIGLATALDKTANKNAIIKVAHGNTSLYNNTTSKESINYGTWTPPSYIEKHNINTVGNRTGDLYLTFIAKVAEGLEKLIEAGYTPNLKGVWYMQGEADTFGAASSGAYEELLTTLISDMRADLTKVSGFDCSELPFAYGRILRKDGIDPNTGKPYMDKTPYVPAVQAAQDAVAAKNIKNVFMVNTTTDLVDPVTGEHRLPVQQDGWHYDSLSQQMIGEKFVSLTNTETRLLTKYGYLPEGAGTNPFAVFKKVDGIFVFDSYKSTFNTAINRATALTHITSGVTDEAVILVIKDFSAGNDYGTDVANSGGTITLDLNGHTLSPSVALFTTKFSDSTASKKTVFNLKNGTMLFQQFGAMFTTGSTSKSQSFDFNVENMSFGFIAGTNNKTGETYKYRDILVSDRNCTTSNGAKITINVNVINSTFDLVTSAQSNATVGTLKENNGNNNCYTDYNLVFEGCTFIASNPDAIACVKSSSGDTVTFVKGDNAACATIILPEATYTQQFDGLDNGCAVKVNLKTVNETTTNGKVYYLVTASDVETPYGIIPAAYSNGWAYPYAIFMKVDGAYVFDSVQSNVKTSFTRATELTHVKTGITDDVVILARKSITADGTYPSNISDIGGTVTLDLNGYTIRPTTTLLRTDWDDDGVVDGVQKKATVNIKNGSIELCQFGILFTTVTSTYTVPKTLDLNLENVKLGFYVNTTNHTAENYKWRDLLVSDRSNSATTKAYINIKATECTFDLATSAQANAVFGTLECGSADHDTNDYNIEIIGGTIVTDDFAKVNCVTKGTGDRLTLKKGADGKYPEVLMNQALAEPSSTESRNGEDGKTVSIVETSAKLDIYKVYEFSEDVMTEYGSIPIAASKYPFAVFYKDTNGEYQFNSGYATYKEAMTAAISLTTAALASPYSEAVILLNTDWSGGSFPSNLSDIATTVTVDLNGHTLGALESLGNTKTGDVKDPDGNIVKTNGTINYKNGKLLMNVHPGLYIAKGSTYTAGYQKTLNVNYDNVYIGLAEGAKTIALLGRIASNLTTETAIFNLKYTNCTIDMATNYSTGSPFYIGNWAPSSGTDATKVTVDFIDCDFLGLTEADFQHRVTAGQDVITYSNTNSDNYATLTLPKDAAAPAGTYLIGSIKAEFVKLSETETTVTYGLVKAPEVLPVVTEYGTIPSDYVNATSYPFAVFSKMSGGEYSFSGAYSKWSTAMKAAQSIISATNGVTANDYVTILLRKDFNIGGDLYSDTSYMGGHLILDLDGHTMTLGTSLMSIKAFDYETGKTCTTYITVKNGSLVNNTKYGIIYSRIEETCTVEKTYYLDFDNVNFSFGESATSKTLLIHSFEQSGRSGSCNINVTYDNCFFDFDTNVPDGADFLNLKSVSSVTTENDLDFKVEFNGCTFEGADAFNIPLGEGDSVTFGDGTILKVANGTAAPTGTYVTNNGNAKLVKTSSVDGDYTIYTLLKESIANYTPQMSLTLDRNLVMNVYLPVDSTLKFTFNGVDYENLAELSENIIVLEDGNKYYHIAVNLPAAEAAKDMKLTVTVGDDTYSVAVNFTFSTFKYAGKLIAGGSDVEKQLAKDVVAYVQAAYKYFTKANTVDEIARVDTLAQELLAIGGAYLGTPTSTGTTATVLPVTAVTLNLDAKPSIRFYVSDTSVKFYIGENKLNTTVGTDSNGTYVELDVYAYALCETITYADGGSYHISDFLVGAIGTSHENLVSCFIKYTESAAAYRNSVLG